MIKLRFVSHPGIFNWACTIAQYGFWATHVEAVTPEGTLIGAMSDGVKAREPFYDAGKFNQEMFLEVSATPEQEDIFYEYLLSQIGKPYDYGAVLSFFYPSRDWQESDHWDCAELIGTSLAMGGFFPQEMAVKYSRVTVRDVLLLISTRTWIP
jgi:uncharacterized protein YycO